MQGSFWKALEASRTLAVWGLEFEAGRGGGLVDGCLHLAGKGFYAAQHHCFSKAEQSLSVSGL